MLKQTAKRKGLGCGKGNVAAVEKHAILAAERKAAASYYVDEVEEFWAAHPELKPKH